MNGVATGDGWLRPGWLSRRPAVGLLAFTAVLLWKPSAHALTVILHHTVTGPAQYVVAALIGLAGFALVWRGFGRDELTATSLGFMGGALIWMGWFEYSFDGFAHLLAVPPLLHEGNPLLSPNLLLIEASAVAYLAVLVFAGANKDTRCRMFLWFHRNFRLRPGDPTPGYRRQFSRITAMEMVFVNWFFYILNILLLDPRVIGPRQPATYAAWFVLLAWGAYLLLARLWQYTAIAGAIRYAIPTVGVFWITVEMGAQFGWYREIWVRPFDFPITNLAFVAAFFLLGALANTARVPASRAIPVA